jgi:hypothetical protein
MRAAHLLCLVWVESRAELMSLPTEFYWAHRQQEPVQCGRRGHRSAFGTPHQNSHKVYSLYVCCITSQASFLSAKWVCQSLISCSVVIYDVFTGQHLQVSIGSLSTRYYKCTNSFQEPYQVNSMIYLHFTSREEEPRSVE